MKRLPRFLTRSKRMVLPPLLVQTLVVCGAFAGGFGLVAGAVYVSEHRAQIAYFFTGNVQVVGQGGPALDPLPEDADARHPKRYVVKGSTTFPSISAKAFLVGDVETGQIIASRHKDDARPIASISKLMTALVADETLSISDETVVSRRAASMTGTRGNLKTGATYTLEELLYPLLLSSGNDAAEAIAEHENRYTFLLDMNAQAAALEMEDTHFEDPSGLSAKNVASPADLFTLVEHLHKYRRYILDITMEKSHKVRGTTWYSNSRFRNYENYVGGKNGFIDASGKTNIALFRLPLEGDDQYRTIAIILLDTRDAVVDTRAITTYLTKYVYYE